MDPPREEARQDVAEQRREAHRDGAGLEHAPPHDRDRLQLVVERRRQEDHDAVRVERVGDLRVPLAAP